jgi:hypothetical protein
LRRLKCSQVTAKISILNDHGTGGHGSLKTFHQVNNGLFIVRDEAEETVHAKSKWMVGQNVFTSNEVRHGM